MSDLFDYLDCSGELYSYLGHFRQARYLEQGHNTGEPGGAEPATFETWKQNKNALEDEDPQTYYQGSSAFPSLRRALEPINRGLGGRDWGHR